jgi:hypothetical protein
MVPPAVALAIMDEKAAPESPSATPLSSVRVPLDQIAGNAIDLIVRPQQGTVSVLAYISFRGRR